jgi:hypothetical protein
MRTQAQKQKKSHYIASVRPKRGTKAAEGFYESWGQINRFFYFVLHLVGHTDEAAERAHKALVDIEDDEVKKQGMIEEWKKRVSATQTLRENRQFFVEVIFIRHVENFLNYLSSLLYEIFTQRPETLRSSDKIEVASVLRHDSVESIVRDLAERKVEALSYSSFTDLVEFFNERFNLQLATTDEIQQISESIEIRNISVHNRCVINKRFISRVHISGEQIGKKRNLYSNDLDRLVPMLARLVKTIDRAASSKLRLRGVRFAKQVTQRGCNIAVNPTRANDAPAG